MAVSNNHIVWLAFIILCLTFSGCSLLKAKEQAELIENVGEIKGTVTVSGSQKGPVIVLRFHVENGTPVLRYQSNAADNGSYQFYVAPGNYYIAAFVDQNNDGQYQKKEHGNYLGGPDIISIQKGETLKLEPIHISDIAPKPATKAKARVEIRESLKNIGKVTSMKNPMFTQDNYSLGMWRPIDFIEQIGWGLFFLQPYDENKVPVLFVHGINGGPTVWKTAIDNLDTEKFQPWVLFYPSGFRLDIISEYLVQAVVSLQKKYRFNQLNVVAHSMGGLVTRSFVKKYRERYPAISKKLKFVMTINSSLGGMESASAGVKHSPIVIPAWNDVTPDSTFLRTIHDWPWPKDIPYHLVFSFKNGSDGDGLVSLESQIPYNAQAESTRIYGFNNDHVGTLNDADFLVLFNKLLDESLEK